MIRWRFIGINLWVAKSPKPGRSGGQRRIVFESPGHDGISATVDDGRLPVKVSATVIARGYAEYEALSLAIETGASGDLEIPFATDSWVYAGAFVEGEPSWERDAPGQWRAKVTFVCPDPRAKWKSTGAVVF